MSELRSGPSGDAPVGGPVVRHRRGGVYYRDKLPTLKRIFGRDDVSVTSNTLTVGDRSYPIVEDVIVLLPPDQSTPTLHWVLQDREQKSLSSGVDYAEDIQFTFGAEWTAHSGIGPDDARMFENYLDIEGTAEALQDKTACDLGCGSGRASFFLKDVCREIILVDFSDAVFAARQNLRGADHCLFFMCNIKSLPFVDDFVDTVICLGVLHHLPTDCLDEVRQLKTSAPNLLIYLYYATDNKAFYFRWLVDLVTLVRLCTCRIRNETFRSVFCWLTALLVYRPLVLLGRLFEIVGLGRLVPLYDGYKTLSVRRIRQNVYDRFFTRIEQRVSRKQVMALEDSFAQVLVSDNLPYWHFLCHRNAL